VDGVDLVKARKIVLKWYSISSLKTKRVYTIQMENGETAAKVLYTGWAGVEESRKTLQFSLAER